MNTSENHKNVTYRYHAAVLPPWIFADEVIINKSIENKTYTNTLAANKKLKNDVISKASKSNK